ncbi:MAG: mechanosensitive ion channel domain-containing protein [Patescibacteria group bacterium]|jgi:small conductance mechanosensitive channel
MEEKILKAVFILLGSVAINQIFAKFLHLSTRNLPGRHKPIFGFMKQGITVILFFLGGLAILSLFGVDMTPYLLSSSIIGFAVAFGAQNTIRDFISGINLLFEPSIKIGRIVRIGDYSGELRKITLKNVYLRNEKNELIIIPNGEVKTIVVKETTP